MSVTTRPATERRHWDPETRRHALRLATEVGAARAARELGISPAVVRQWRYAEAHKKTKPPAREMLANGPFRELCLTTMLEQDIPLTVIASRAGMDESRVRRVLGLSAEISRHGKQRVVSQLSYPVAVRIVRACDAYPVDYGV